jgi:hypothetical protein
MSLLRSLTTAIGVLLLATPLIAQTNTTPQDTTAVNAPMPASATPAAVLIDRASPANVPLWVNARSFVRVSSPQPAAVRDMDSGPTARNKALMIVGGAGIIAGAVVGGKPGTLLMGASGLVGLVGLWNYLK